MDVAMSGPDSILVPNDDDLEASNKLLKPTALGAGEPIGKANF